MKSYFCGFIKSKADIENATILISNLQYLHGKTVAAGNGLFINDDGDYLTALVVIIINQRRYTESELLGSYQTILNHINRYELHEPSSNSLPYVAVYVDTLEKVGDL